MGTVRLSWLFFKIGVLNELQYRVNFVVQLFQSAIALVVGLVVLALVYSHTSELNGWSKSELLCVLGIQILMGGAIKTYIQPNMIRLLDEVREGKLDYALTKPEDSQVIGERARGADLAGRRPRLGHRRPRCRTLAADDERRRTSTRSPSPLRSCSAP